MTRIVVVLSALLLALIGCERREDPVQTHQPTPTPRVATEADDPTIITDQDIREARRQTRELGQPEEAAPQAEETAEAGPETVTLEARNGNVTFNHRAHAAMTECRTCHGEGPPGPVELDRESGHALCLECHRQQQAGPQACTECHRRQ